MSDPQRFEELPQDGSLADPLPEAPWRLLERWLDEAREQRVQPNPGAMALATCGADGRPSLRLVLCRGLDVEAGGVVFYTNRRSRKGRELAGNPFAAATFHWDALSRQARLEGRVSEISDAASDAYFASRPRLSQVAAWASDQSEPIGSRQELLRRLVEAERRFGEVDEIPRPPHWGGYLLVADAVELWVGSTGRAHDRARWTRQEDGWKLDRLQP